MEQKKSIRRPISTGLIGHLHGLYARYGLDEETRRGMILDLTKGRTDSTRDLTYSEGQYLSGYIQGAAHENRDLSVGETSTLRSAGTSAKTGDRHHRLGQGERLPL